VPAETRRDIYTEVAAVVSRMVTEDAGAGDELARHRQVGRERAW
jgi:DNA-directed RNA polymerase